MNHLKRILIIVSALLVKTIANSMPAYPAKIPVIVNGKTILISLKGDEHNKHAETLDGFSIIQKNSIWYYAEKDKDGYLIASPHKLSAELDKATLSFLKTTSQHLHQKKENSSNRLQIRRNSKKKQAVGNRRILIILMQFPDVKFTKEQSDFYRLFNEQNYKEDGAYGSVYDFYSDVSYGKLQLSCDVIGPYTSQHERAYYGGNERNGDDKNPEALFNEAMEYASVNTNLKRYDADNDGYIDNVHIIFAGHGEEAGASSDAIWSHEATYFTPFTYQNILVDRYSCAPELRGNSGSGISRIGPHCHEIGHALGAMDYYDTNYDEQGQFEGTGNWDVMAGGSWNADGAIPADFNPYVKMMDFGWIDIKEMPTGMITLPPSLESEENYYRISNNENDYYLVENRSSTNWGQALPGSGLLVYHIHPNITNVGNQINATYPQMCYPVCASTTYDIPSNLPASYGKINSSGCPFPGSTDKRFFNATSVPAAFSWDYAESNINLQNITISKEGMIMLTNLSKVENSTQGDVLINDNFESISNYTIETHIGDTNWGWVKVDESQKEKNSIEAHEGTGYLRFQPGKLSSGIQKGSVIFKTSKAINKYSGYLSLFYQGVGYRTGLTTMDISYKCDDGEWNSISIAGNGKSGWKNYYLILPEAYAYSIKITGYASYGQTVCLDDLMIMHSFPTQIQEINIDAPSYNSLQKQVFDLMGRRINKLRKGINIIKLPNGQVIKEYVK
jgi:M6 family metalloprotease-like protein